MGSTNRAYHKIFDRGSELEQDGHANEGENISRRWKSGGSFDDSELFPGFRYVLYDS